jgi:hypothetical protein
MWQYDYVFNFLTIKIEIYKYLSIIQLKININTLYNL